MKQVECVVDGVTYRRYRASSNKEDCEGCAGQHDSELCLHLDSCGSIDNDGGEDYIWKKVEKYVDKKLKKK